MLSNLIPSMSRHFMYSIMEHDYESGMEMINTILNLFREEIGQFLVSLGDSFDDLFCRLEVDVDGYYKIKDEVIEILKNPVEEDVEEFY